MNEQKKLEIRTAKELLYEANEKLAKLLGKETQESIEEAEAAKMAGEILAYLRNSRWVSVKSLRQWINYHDTHMKPCYCHYCKLLGELSGLLEKRGEG